MEKTITIDTALIRSWIEAKLSVEDVEAQLHESGFSKETITIYLRQYKKERYAGRRFKGFVCMGIGAFLGFVSCVLTLTNPIPELFNIILFGLTSIAILVICLGLYFVFE
jgi:hypothetical protein